MSLRLILAAVALAVALPAAAQTPAPRNPLADGAIALFKAIEADAARHKTFCDMLAALREEEAETDEQKAAEHERAFEAGMTAMGLEFAGAWGLQMELDEGKADGKDYFAAFDALIRSCPAAK